MPIPSPEHTNEADIIYDPYSNIRDEDSPQGEKEKKRIDQYLVNL